MSHLVIWQSAKSHKCTTNSKWARKRPFLGSPLFTTALAVPSPAAALNSATFLHQRLLCTNVSYIITCLTSNFLFLYSKAPPVKWSPDQDISRNWEQPSDHSDTKKARKCPVSGLFGRFSWGPWTKVFYQMSFNISNQCRISDLRKFRCSNFWEGTMSAGEVVVKSDPGLKPDSEGC